MEFRSCHVKYVFSDVEAFTREDRSREAQVEIIDALNNAFMAATEYHDGIIFLPTGDGICLGITDPTAPFDLHLQVALRVLEEMHNWSENQGMDNRKCRIRMGLNEAVDQLITDINGNSNLIGAGINHAQRVMSLADGNQIAVSQATFDSLFTSDNYRDKFFAFEGPTKQRPIIAYLYRDVLYHKPFLNIQTPSAVVLSEPIAMRLSKALSYLAENDYADQCGAINSAASEWSAEGNSLVRHIFNQQNAPCCEELKNIVSSCDDYLRSIRAYRTALGSYYSAEIPSDSCLECSQNDVDYSMIWMMHLRLRAKTLSWAYNSLPQIEQDET